MHELDGHQLEGCDRRYPFGEIGVLPRDLLRDSGSKTFCLSSPSFEGNCREIDGSHLPTAFSEPDGICSFACTNVEGRAATQVGGFGYKMGIRFPAPHLWSGSVALVPEGFVHLAMCSG